MSTQKVNPVAGKHTPRVLSRMGAGAGITAAIMSLGLGAGAVAAQAPLGVPFIGDNHLSFYSTELTSDGTGAGMSTLYGGRYAHRFGEAESPMRFSLGVQVAARQLDAPNDGVIDATVTAAWTRSMAEVDPRLSATVGVGANALAWGAVSNDGVAHASVPITMGISYDLTIGRATVSPFVAPSVAYYVDRTYVNDVRVSSSSGWDGRISAGASLRLREVVLTTSRIRGEEGLPHSSRWTFAAGISF
jgi:hypothetical protein